MLCPPLPKEPIRSEGFQNRFLRRATHDSGRGYVFGTTQNIYRKLHCRRVIYIFGCLTTAKRPAKQTATAAIDGKLEALFK